MRILYSPVGDTDPIRGCYDGAMLHIVRYYNPDMVVMVLSADMEHKEATTGLYSRALRHVKPNIDVRIIPTGLTDVHRIDTLQPLVDNFYTIMDEYPDAEILMNLSSGTPQMKLIMSYLSVDHDSVRGIQVDSPQHGSNRREPALQSEDNIDTLIENNFDDQEETENRCHEPQMGYIRRNNIKQSLRTLISSYKYKEAIEAYKSYKRTFQEAPEQDILPLLTHAQLRMKLEYDGALNQSRKIGSLPLSSVFSNKDLRKLHEYLMLMEIRLNQGQIEDFILKITPFMYTLMRYYVADTFKVDWRKVEKRTNMGKRLILLDFSKAYPSLYHSWVQHNKFPQVKDIQLSFYHILHMLDGQSAVDPSLLKELQRIRTVEQKIRNKMAHEITMFTEKDICAAGSIQSLQAFLHQIQSVFTIISKQDKHNKLIYDRINQYVLEQIK